MLRVSLHFCSRPFRRVFRVYFNIPQYVAGQSCVLECHRRLAARLELPGIWLYLVSPPNILNAKTTAIGPVGRVWSIFGVSVRPPARPPVGPLGYHWFEMRCIVMYYCCCMIAYVSSSPKSLFVLFVFSTFFFNEITTLNDENGRGIHRKRGRTGSGAKPNRRWKDVYVMFFFSFLFVGRLLSNREPFKSKRHSRLVLLGFYLLF